MGSRAASSRNGQMTSDLEETVTAVVTSCGRYDLLKQTLDSFLSFNSYPMERTIVVEDGPDVPLAVRSRYPPGSIEWLATGNRVGQIAAIDHAYARVTSEYVFHLEDDWEFYRPGFIERSLPVLLSDPACLLVWIRSPLDTQGHTVGTTIYCTDGVPWRRMALDYDMNGVMWHGFTFNPGLRRLADYVAIGSYGSHAHFDFRIPWSAENAIAKIYRARGFYAGILCDQDGAGYVRHIGRGRRVAPPRIDELI
jgi:hypothetical protein